MPSIENSIHIVEDSVIRGWNSKINSSSLQLSSLVPFVELYTIYSPKDVDRFNTEPSGKYRELLNKFIYFEVVGDESNTYPDGTKLNTIQLAAVQSQMQDTDRTGGIGINSLDISRGLKESFTINYDMNITITNPQLFQHNIEYSKFITLNAPFLVIYGWNGSSKFGFPGPPFVSPGKITSINLKAENNGFWKAALCNLRKYDLSFNSVGQLEGTISFMSPYTATLTLTRAAKISFDMLSVLKNPLNNEVISIDEIRSTAPRELREFMPNDIGIKVRMNSTTNVPPQDTIQIPNKASANFTIEQFARSDTARQKNIDNTPTPEAIENIRILAQNVLEPLQAAYPNNKINITSGFRSIALNSAISNKGADNSNHLTGRAADIQVTNVLVDEIYLWLRDHIPGITAKPNELINENIGGKRWVHIGYHGSNSNQATQTQVTQTQEYRTQFYYLGWILEIMKNVVLKNDPIQKISFTYKNVNGNLDAIYTQFLKDNRLDQTDTLRTLSIRNVFQIPIRAPFLEEMLQSSNMPLIELVRNVISRGSVNLPIDIGMTSINGTIELSVLNTEINGIIHSFVQTPIGDAFDIDFGSSNSLCESIDLSARLDPNAIETNTLPILVGGRRVNVVETLKKAKLDGDLLAFVRQEGRQEQDIGRIEDSLIEKFIGSDPTYYTRLIEVLFDEGNILSALLGFYLRKTTVKIHGTVGIYGYNAIRIRGLIKGLSGIYNVISVNEQLTPSSFSTTLEATLLDTI